MFDLSKKERGAVAVFLVIVLVPMITCAALFVEAARVKLAQPVVSSAGELAINTVLTNYDYDLNDYYGMLASAQNMDDVITAAQEYFKASMVSQGVDTTFAKKYDNLIAGMFNGDTSISDFLDISVVEGEGSLITPTTNGALNNAALIKTQIVDFMKFRSPINTAAALLDSFTQLGKDVETIPDQTECLDKQQEFYDTEEELLDVANQAYEIIQKYNDLKITKTYIENMKTNIAKYRDDYYRIHKKLVFDLAGTEGIGSFSKQSISYAPTINTYSANKKPSFNNTKQLLINVAKAMQTYSEKRSALVNLNNSITYNSSTTYSTRYYVNIMNELKKNNQYDKYISAANDLSTKVAKLKNAYTNLGEQPEGADWDVNLAVRSGVNTSGDKHISEHYNSLVSQFNSIVNNDFKNGSSTYNAFSNRMVGISNNIKNVGSVVPANNTDATDGGINRGPANTAVNAIYNEINGYYDKICDGYKKVDDSVKKLEKLKKLIPGYQSDYNTWKNAANKESLNDNELAEESRKDIAEREKNPEVMKNITEQKVQELIDRLNNIKSALGEVKSVLEGFKYNGKKILDIETLSDFENKSGVKAADISTLKSEINNYVNSTFNFESKASTLNITNNNNPDLVNVNTPPIYNWMKGFFAEKPVSTKYKYTKKEAKQKNKDMKKLKNEGMDQTETSTSTGISSKELKSAPNLPSGSPATGALKTEKSSDMTKLSTFISDLFGDFGGTMTKAGTALRDNLYTLDYIMSMFSYDTYESEGLLDLWREKNPDTTITLQTDFKSSVQEQWKNTDPTFKNNKSLTNHIINDSTCYSYGNEVEYILYGGTNSANKGTAYGTIYMIRLALNVGPIFGKFFSGDYAVEALATSISAASCGVIPVPIIKFAICLGLAVAESAIDLSYIKKGVGVRLIKSKDMLFVSFQGEGTINKGGSSSQATGVGAPTYLQYSDYLSILMFISLLNSGKADAIYLRTADVIQSNVAKIIGKPKDYKLSQANVYYTINAQIKVNPLLFEAPLIDNSIQNGSVAESYSALQASKWNTFSYSATRGY